MDRWGLQNETQYHNRVHVGQITGVRPAEGLITVRTTAGTILKMPIPVYGFSPPVAQADGTLLRSGTQSSWIRYMPQVGDFVKVAYGPDNRPEVIAAATWGDLPAERGPAGQLGGYAALTRARDRGEPGLETFYTLEPGEWDMRSSGNAYIRGGRYGTLTLRGGGVLLRLQKEQEELTARAGLLSFDSAGCTLRVGDVKRTLANGFQAETVTGSGKEFDLTVDHQVTPSPTLPNSYYRLRAGDLRDADGVEEVGTAGGALRLQERVLDGIAQTGQPVPYVREVDTNGNVREALGANATRHTVTGSSVCEYSRSGYLTLTHQATQNVKLDSAVIDLVASSAVHLGSASATQAVPKGNDLVKQIQEITVLTAFGPSSKPVNTAAFPATLSTKVFTE